jgi:hypothetical protein
MALGCFQFISKQEEKKSLSLIFKHGLFVHAH